MKATVIKPFRRHEQDLAAGESFECERHEFNKWALLGFVQAYETKVKAPAEKKSSRSAPAGQASRKKTAKKRAKSAKKS